MRVSLISVRAIPIFTFCIPQVMGGKGRYAWQPEEY